MANGMVTLEEGALERETLMVSVVPSDNGCVECSELSSVCDHDTSTDTAMSKVSLTVPPAPSSAVTLTESVPTLADCGVPEKVRVPGVKDSQDGRGAVVGTWLRCR